MKFNLQFRKFINFNKRCSDKAIETIHEKSLLKLSGLQSAHIKKISFNKNILRIQRTKKMALNKSMWNKHFVVSKKKKLHKTHLLSPNDDYDDDCRFKIVNKNELHIESFYLFLFMKMIENFQSLGIIFDQLLGIYLKIFHH